MLLFDKTNWIWMQNMTAEEKEKPIFVMFRKTVHLGHAVQSAVVKVSAANRYKFYVNGALAEVGPSKGDAQVWFEDTLDLMPYLKEGDNCMAVEVLCYMLAYFENCKGYYEEPYAGKLHVRFCEGLAS